MLPPDVAARPIDSAQPRAVVDYLAGMTDRYATDEYRRLFDPTALT
jgi:dGTPase